VGAGGRYSVHMLYQTVVTVASHLHAVATAALKALQAAGINRSSPKCPCRRTECECRQLFQEQLFRGRVLPFLACRRRLPSRHAAQAYTHAKNVFFHQQVIWCTQCHQGQCEAREQEQCSPARPIPAAGPLCQATVTGGNSSPASEQGMPQ